jgi:hypothetical protein
MISYCVHCFLQASYFYVTRLSPMKTHHEKSEPKWTLEKVDTFWNKIALHHQVFHVYENEDNFLSILAGFVGTGVNADDCTIVIATANRLEKLKHKLELFGLHVKRLVEDERYIPVAVDNILPAFMVNGLPDEELFFNAISEIIKVGKKRKRVIRAFREMTAILHEEGNHDAVSALEALWNKYSRQENICLFSACPEAYFLNGECASLRALGFHSTKLVTHANSASEILYKNCHPEL